MGKIKRKLNLNSSKKIISISSIENLSNEIFYEIFDYLDGCYIYQAFSNLNQYFSKLVNSSSILFKIKFHSTSNKLYENFFKQITSLNKHQIYSMNLSLPLKNKHFFSSFLIDSSLNHLKNLSLHQLKLNLLLSILSNLSTLPNLSSLIIDISDIKKHVTNIYRIVLTLPRLEYFKLSTDNSNSLISLPIPNDEQYSLIKYLFIHHSCTFNELSNIICYTPQLRSLHCLKNNINSLDMEIILPIPTLTNLTNLYLFMYEIQYEQFEIFIIKIGLKLKTFRCFTLSEDLYFLDAIRWEQLIKNHLPQLKQFVFQYREYADDEYQSPQYIGELNQFISSFWIERQWQFQIEFECNYIIYAIYPYEKAWFEFNTQFNNPLSKSTRLILTDISSLESQELINMHISRALNVAQIYHLEIRDEEIFNGTLLEAVDLLPDLITLDIHSLLFEESTDLSEEVLSRENTNQITKVYLEIMMEITDIYFLMVICPKMEYLWIGSINDLNVEVFVREILDKINSENNQYLRLLCFSIEGANDELIQQLENMINTEKLIVDYSIRHVYDNIYLQWK